MTRTLFVLLPLSFLICSTAFGQEDTRRKRDRESIDSTIVIGKGRIVHQGRIYRQNAPFVTLGYGAGYGFESKQVEQSMSFSYHHFIKNVGLQAGYLSSSTTRTWWNSDQKLKELSLGGGVRKEGARYNLSAFAGPSWASGSYLYYNEANKLMVHYFSLIGLHAELLATYKIAYDIGAGFSLYGSLNSEYSVVGAQFHLYFSTAFVRNYD